MNRLRELREEKKLSLAKLSKEVGISAGALGNYEREAREPRIETWEVLADYFDVPVAYLMGVSDEKESPEETTYKMLELLSKKIDGNDKVHSELTKSFKNSPTLFEFLKGLTQFIEPGTYEGDMITETIKEYIILVMDILSSDDHVTISELLEIIRNIRLIYWRSTSKETLYSKEMAIGKHLENLNTVTDILNSWYMTEIDQIKYNSKQSHGLE